MRPSLMLLELLEQPHDALACALRACDTAAVLGRLSTFAGSAAVGVCIYHLSICMYVCMYYILSMYFASIRPGPGMRTREMVPTEWGVPAVRFGRDQTTVSRATASGSLPSGVWRSFHFLCLRPMPGGKAGGNKAPDPRATDTVDLYDIYIYLSIYLTIYLSICCLLYTSPSPRDS